MKRISLIFIIVLIAVPIFAKEKPTLGIGVIQAGEGVTSAQMDFITDFIYDGIYRMGSDRFNIIARSRRNQILKELEFSLSDVADESQTIKIGRLLGAKYMIFGNCGKFGSSYYLTLQLIDVTTSTVIGSSRNSTNTIDGMEKTVDANIAKLLAVDLIRFQEFEYPTGGFGVGMLCTGLAAIGVGFITLYFSNQYSAQAASALTIYNNATSDFDNLWNDYTQKQGLSQGLFYSSIGLWAGGAILTGVSFFLIFNRVEKASKIAFNVIPQNGGIRFALKLRY